MNTDEINKILESHSLWIEPGKGGERANLAGADLSGADLSGAYLSRANLSGADLRNAVGNMVQIKTVICETYPVSYTAEVMQIGCRRYPIKDWWDFVDNKIIEMDGKNALKFWRKWKPLLQQIIEASPAEPTGFKEDGDEHNNR